MGIIFLCTNLSQPPGPTIAGIFPGCVVAHRHPASFRSLALAVCLAVNLSLTLCPVLQHAATNSAFSRYILRDLCVRVFVYILKSCRCDVHKYIPIFAGLLAKIRIQKVSLHASSMVFEFLQHRGDAELEIAQVSIVSCSVIQWIRGGAKHENSGDSTRDLFEYWQWIQDPTRLRHFNKILNCNHLWHYKRIYNFFQQCCGDFCPHDILDLSTTLQT